MRNSNEHPVLVTGATGFVGAWIVHDLLEAGHRVHATVRDLSRSKRLRPLEDFAADSPGTLEWFQADLTRPGSFRRALSGCRRVIHVASPFLLSAGNPKRDLWKPAVEGTRTLLTDVNASDSVERVVITSSVAAMAGDNADFSGPLTPDDWNTSSTLDHQPYAFSKVEAERLAWEMASEQAQWSLATINPSLVLGPGFAGATESGSFELISNLMSGRFAMGVPHFPIGTVDVRDVAAAHIAAAFSTASGRFIAHSQTKTLADMARVLLEQRPDLPLSARTLPTWLLWLVGPAADPSLTRRMIRRNFGHPFDADTSQTRAQLGVAFRDTRGALAAMAQQLTH